jgi:hypothetical protein
LVNRTSGFLKEKFRKSGGVWIHLPQSQNPFKIEASSDDGPISQRSSSDRKKHDETKAIFLKTAFDSHRIE